MKHIIYADHAATTPLSDAARAAMEPFYTECFYNPSTKYSSSGKSRKAIQNARQSIARCIGAKPSEIYFTSGGTESDNWAIKGTMLIRNDYQFMITDTIEHHAILNACASIERMGVPVTYMCPNESGTISTDELNNLITDSTRLVSVMTVNNELGTIQPIKALAELAHAHGAMFHTDAVQAVGHLDIDVNELGVDMLSASAHKFGGPKGVGFLYIRDGLSIEPLLSGGGQESGLRAGTENVPGIVGMAAALSESCDKIKKATEHLNLLREYLINQLNKSGLDYCINGGKDVYPGIINLSIRGISGEMVLHRLDLMGIQIGTGSACDSKETQVSHVLAAIRLPNEYALGTIRISLGFDNSLSDIESIVQAIVKICERKAIYT